MTAAQLFDAAYDRHYGSDAPACIRCLRHEDPRDLDAEGLCAHCIDALAEEQEIAWAARLDGDAGAFFTPVLTGQYDELVLAVEAL